MEADAMTRVKTYVITAAAFAAFGFVSSPLTARGDDPDAARAAAAIERAGGWVSPGVLFFPQGSVVVIEGDKATDKDLVHLRYLSGVSVLSLDGTRITDAGLAHLEGLKNVKALSLEHTQVTDAGLAHLEGLKKLRELDLKGTQITDAGLDHLKELRRLRKLTISETKVSAEGIKKLRRSLPFCRIR
jgi:hypothetical protein